MFLILYEDGSLLYYWKQAIDYWCPSGIPNDVLKESIVRSANEKSDRFLYLAVSRDLQRRYVFSPDFTSANIIAYTL